MFIAPKGCELWVLDYDQLQLRIAAGLSGDPALIKAFKDGLDVHEQTRLALGITDRTIAKNANFAMIFGTGGETFAKTINKERQSGFITIDEATALLEKLRRAYPMVRDAYFRAERLCKHGRGWVHAPSGRRRYIEYPHHAFNTQIQMVEADITKNGLLTLDRMLPPGHYIQNFIHDEYQIVVPESTVIEPADLQRALSCDFKRVPITLSFKRGASWGTVA
jgi:DNA polymerase-1